MLKSFTAIIALAQASVVSDLIEEGYYTQGVEALKVPVSNSGKGFDISSLMSVTNATCLHTAGYTTAIVRAYRSSGSVDPNACASLNNAKSAGILNRDVYMFPCPTCSATAA